MPDDDLQPDQQQLEDAQQDDEETGDPPQQDPPAQQQQRRVVGRGGAPLSDEAVSKAKAEARAAERKRLLRDEYGTDDEKEIERIRADRKAKIEEAERLRKEAEDRKRSEMSEIERLKQDIAERDTEIARLKQERDSAQQSLASERQGFKIRSVASQFVAAKPVLIEGAVDAFRRHVVSLTKDEQRKLGDAQITKWFRDFVRDNPEFAPAAARAADDSGTGDGDDMGKPKTPPAPPAPKPRVPVGARPGTVPARRPSVANPPRPAGRNPGTTESGKTARPGQANSMSRSELNAHVKKQGLKPW